MLEAQVFKLCPYIINVLIIHMDCGKAKPAACKITLQMKKIPLHITRRGLIHAHVLFTGEQKLGYMLHGVFNHN